MNHVTLIGTLTHDLILDYSNENKYVIFNVEINNNDKKNYINCIAWNEIAENMVKCFAKNSLLFISGELTTSTNVNKQQITEVKVNSITFSEKNKELVNSNN